MQSKRIEQLLMEAWSDGHASATRGEGSIAYDADLENFLEQNEAEINSLACDSSKDEVVRTLRELTMRMQLTNPKTQEDMKWWEDQYDNIGKNNLLTRIEEILKMNTNN